MAKAAACAFLPVAFCCTCGLWLADVGTKRIELSCEIGTPAPVPEVPGPGPEVPGVPPEVCAVVGGALALAPTGWCSCEGEFCDDAVRNTCALLVPTGGPIWPHIPPGPALDIPIWLPSDGLDMPMVPIEGFGPSWQRVVPIEGVVAIAFEPDVPDGIHCVPVYAPEAPPTPCPTYCICGCVSEDTVAGEATSMGTRDLPPPGTAPMPALRNSCDNWLPCVPPMMPILPILTLLGLLTLIGLIGLLGLLALLGLRGFVFGLFCIVGACLLLDTSPKLCNNWAC